MKLTKEQIDIVNSSGNIKINAVAGSGKTTTMVEYAKSRPKTSRILYLAFNKSVKLEAERKYKSQGLVNVKVETAHSLAYKYVVPRKRYKIRAQGYKIYEIAEILGLQVSGERHTEFIIANHISKFASYFCNSDKSKVQEINYLDTVTDAKAKDFVTNYYRYIEKQTRIFLGKMDKGEIEITHDFYLKKFQLSNPKLPYDYILFDEGQDASAAMLDVFLKQSATKVIVGDTHQQIYSWRYAINSLEKVDFATYHLSTSFRFSQEIANLAMEVLAWKKHIGSESVPQITGKGKNNKSKKKAIIARTNLGLLLEAIMFIEDNPKVNHIYFEGNINSYTYAEDGTSLYDVLHLYNNKHKFIRDILINKMRNMEDLEEYITNTEDVQLSMMVALVEEYGNDIPEIIKEIKQKHVDNDDKELAEVIFSTVHRCKGMEYDSIVIADDFITEERIEKTINNKEADNLNIAKINEEINLLYVAVTRSSNTIDIPMQLLPSNIPLSNQIRMAGHTILSDSKDSQKGGDPQDVVEKKSKKIDKAYTVEDIRKQYSDAYKPWTTELDDELTMLYCSGSSISELAAHFGRTKGSIRSRISKLELEDLYS